MALDNLEAIRDYRDRVEELCAQPSNTVPAVAMAPHTMLTLLETLLREIDRLSDAVPNPSRDSRMESVAEIVSLDQRRKIRAKPGDIVGNMRDGFQFVHEGDDLVPLD